MIVVSFVRTFKLENVTSKLESQPLNGCPEYYDLLCFRWYFQNLWNPKYVLMSNYAKPFHTFELLYGKHLVGGNIVHYSLLKKVSEGTVKSTV